MAVFVPNTNTYSLVDVWNAVKDHTPTTTGDLQDCFDNAISTYFDPTYNNNTYAPPNSMKRFRNYGPKGTPVTGTFTMPFPSYSGYRTVGRLIFVSPDGSNLYAVVTVMAPTVYHQLVRFTMSNFDLRTIAFHSERNLGYPPSLYVWRTLRFNPTGTRIMLISDDQILDGNNSRIETFVLSSAWSVTSVSSWYATTPVTYYSALNRRAMRMAFSETGDYLAVYHRFLSNQYLDFYYLSTAYQIPSGTINSYGPTVYGTSFMANDIAAFDIFESSFSPGKSEVGLSDVYGYANIGTIRIDKTPWNAYYPYSNEFYLNPFKVADAYTTPQRLYTFAIENNPGSSDPLKPRVYMRIN